MELPKYVFSVVERVTDEKILLAEFGPGLYVVARKGKSKQIRCRELVEKFIDEGIWSVIE